MRKEYLFAIIFGSIFGLVIAFGIWRANSAIKLKTSQISTSDNQEDKVVQNNNELGLVLIKPKDKDVISESPIKLSGITKPKATVVVSLPDQDYIFSTDEDGSFEQEIELSGGVNQIIIKSYDENGNSKENLIKLVYSTEFL